MKKVTAQIKGIAAYSSGKMVEAKKETKETHEEFEQRVWRLKMNATPDGYACIPPTAWKNGIAEAAKYLSLQVPGKGKATYTKHFEAGVLCVEPLKLNVKIEDLQCEKVFVPADGKRGSGKRVFRWFPHVPPGWGGEISFHIVDETVLNKMPGDDMTVFEHVLTQMGNIIGVGRFRPRNNGFYGRFIVSGLKIEEA